MSKSWIVRVFGVAVLAAASGGCVSAQEHREALADLQRLRMEAWQRSVEASSLRIALDRAAAENAQIRQPVAAIDQSQTLAAVAAKLDEISRRQEIIEDELKTSSACVQPSATVTPVSGQAVAQPRGRKVTDLLYSRF